MIKRILTSIWFLAIFIAIPVILVFPPLFNKYNCKPSTESKKLQGTNPAVYFEDLDSDGEVERIESFSQPTNGNIVSFQYFNENGGMVEQINFRAKYHNDTNRLFFADADGDGNKEIYLFSFENDSLVLNWLQVTPVITPFQRLPICKINYYNQNLLNYSIGNIFCLDLENDGQKELIFSVIGGYSYSPRQIFKVDIRKRKVDHSLNTGSACGTLSFYDLDDDGKLEIISEGQVAPDRDWFNLPYNAPAPYLKVFRSDLTFFFPPVKFFEGIQSITQTFVSNNGTANELICTFMSSSSECEPLWVYKINLQGEKTDSLVYDDCDRMRSKYVFQNDKDNFVTQIKPSQFLEFNSDLKVVKTIKLKGKENLNLISKTDINKDGIYEYFLAGSESSKIYLISDNFRWNHTIFLDNQLRMSGDDLIREPGQFYIKTAIDYTIYNFTKNPFYVFRFFFYLLIYLSSLLIVYIFQKILESRLREKYELQNKVQELQLKTLKNQLDPHFIFNTFNSIASVIQQGEKDEAYDLFVHMSKMVRKNLEISNEIFTTLEDELAIIKDYLAIQKFRFKGLFNYEIEIDECVDKNLMIPKMLIQLHVENALKHGLKLKGEGGSLFINVKCNGSQIEFVVEDNGIGREAAKENNTSGTEIGLKAMKQLIEAYNAASKRKLSYKIIDKFNGVKPTGTKIQIILQ